MPTRLEQLTKLHSADPADPFCTYGIALEHFKLGQLAEALSWLDKTLQTDVHYAYAYFQKAKVLIAQGQPEQARQVLQAGIADAKGQGTPDSLHAAQEMAELLGDL